MECRLEGMTLHYHERGEGRPILILHGWPLDHRHVMSEMEPLFEARRGWNRIYPDLPGMGRTAGADWITHQVQMLEVTLDFIDQVTEGQRFVVAGESYGAYLARGVLRARSASIDGLLLIVPVIRALDAERHLPPRTTVKEDPDLLAELGPEEAETIKQIAAVQDRAFLEWLRSDIFPAVARADQEFLSQVRENYAFSFDVDDLDESSGAPTLLLMGRQDSVCGYRDAWDLIEAYPRATFAVLDRAGHGLSIEQRGLFTALVDEWLDRVEEYASDRP